jgi:hypothetical protein
LRITLFILCLFISLNGSFAKESSSVAIFVEAGAPQTICYGETLEINLLGASISGDVTDGLWFTLGDGLFLPGNNVNGIFSITDQYQPGPEDLSNGSFTLILVSDDPDGNGPMVEVSDQVLISFMNAPALVCNSNINVSLAESCEQEVDVFMLLANPSEPYDKYTIELEDENGDIIPNNILTVDHLGMNITFTVGHSCTNSTCSGEITVNDNIPPFLNCLDAEIECDFGVSPEIVGFPVPFYAVVTSIDEYTFLVENFDACSDVTLTFQDIEVEMTCASTGYIKEITRSWFAEDESGNNSSCEQIILVRPLPLSAVMSPPDYDFTDEPALSCDGDWEALPNGYPSPESTGMPAFPDCGNIAATYSDVYFEQCGSGFKVVRQWFVIDWCTSESFNENQIIKVLDQEGPIFECPEDLTISSQGYECISQAHELVFVDSVYDCSEFDYSFKVLTLDSVDVSSFYIEEDTILVGLPVGEYLLVYIATDVCSNASQCTTLVTIIDDSAPFAVCDGYTKIALGSNGVAELWATSVDDGSFDNCGDITMQIAKMTDECSWGLNFGPKVHFCCDEVGDSILVAFQVTDEEGLSNTCMVTVLVEDKLPPTITCPDDLTISCSYVFDPEDLSIFGSVVEGLANVEPIIINGNLLGSDGYFTDNCEASVAEESVSDLDCGAGTITRTFTATDLYGQSATCTQVITIVSDNPFLENDITWPSNFEMNGCDTIQADPSVTDEPSWIDNKCALVGSTYEDQIFYISGGACIKILREWTVIDWCQYEAGQSIGIWTYLQEIKLKNNIAPTILECTDKDICSYDEDCTSELVTITAFANDDCTDSLNLLYLWSIDLDDNGTIDDSGQGISFSKELLFGDHRVFWTVEDGCGNLDYCNYKITVRDCKNPTPYCNSSITTTIMPSAGMIQVWAVDYDFGSYDNCTAPEDLIFSFSQDISDDNRVIVCDSIENGIAQEFTFELWVTDEYGNQERCEVTFIVQDNADVCNNGTIKGKISGKVISQHDKYIPDVEMDYTASIDTFSGMEMTDAEGLFELESTPEYLKYVFRPTYESDPNSGVSTLDLVMVQRHILEIAPFDNPYDILASDVSGNEKVTSSDLVTLRKMILGIIAEWPKDQANWVFVDSSHVFPDVSQPFYYPDSIVIQTLLDTADQVNFVAVKMGDVNGSFNPGLKGDNYESGTRDDASFQMDAALAKDDNGAYEYQFSLNEGHIIDGLQFSLPIPNGTKLESDYLNEADYIVMDGTLKVSWVNSSLIALDGESFIKLISPAPIDLLFGDDMSPEIYIDLEPFALILNDSPDNNLSIFTEEVSATIKASPTAFQNDLNLIVTGQYNVIQLEIMDSRGSLIFKNEYKSAREIAIPASQFQSTGIYFIKAIIDRKLQTLKVVHI